MCSSGDRPILARRWPGWRQCSQAIALQPTIAVVDTGADLRVPAARGGAACALRRSLARPGRARPERARNAGRRAHRARGSAGAAPDHPRRQLERRVQRRQRGRRDPLRGRPRCAHRQSQSRRCRARRRVERAAVRYAIDRGALVVAAAGDDYASRPEYPAALLGTHGLAVAAVRATAPARPSRTPAPGCRSPRPERKARRSRRRSSPRPPRRSGPRIPTLTARQVVGDPRRRPHPATACARTSSASACRRAPPSRARSGPTRHA